MNYTPEHVIWLKENVKGKSFSELTTLFNTRFGLNVPVQSIKAACKNRGLSNGRYTRFIKGQKPWCTGIKGVLKGSPTSYSKGQRPWNWCPVGSERKNSDGYLRIKIAEPNVWEFKHLLVWVSAYGAIPKGHAILFSDGNKLNCEPENLVAVTRAELAVLNKHGLIFYDSDSTKAGINIAKIKIAVRKRVKECTR